MAQNRSERQNANAPSLPVLAEVLRQSCEAKEETSNKEEAKLPTFWKVFGSTVLSIAAMVAVTAYQALSSNLAEVRSETAALSNEMRKEFARLAESQGELVKKDECDSRFRCVWGDVNELKDDRKDLLALKEQVAALTKMHQDSERARRELVQELQALREKRIQQEERRALAAEVSALRERLAGLEGKQAQPATVEPAKEKAPTGKVGRLQQTLDAVRAGLGKIGFVNVYSSDPNLRIEQLLKQSEDLREIEQEWKRIWFTDQPSNVTYDRIHGSIE